MEEQKERKPKGRLSKIVSRLEHAAYHNIIIIIITIIQCHICGNELFGKAHRTEERHAIDD